MSDSTHNLKIGNNSYIRFCDNMCEESGVSSMEDESVHLCFTSPPYFNYVDYAGDAGVGKEDEYSSYLAALYRIFGRVYDKLVPGGKLVINTSNMSSRRDVDGDVSFLRPIAFDTVAMVVGPGYILKDEIIWHKAGGNAGSLGGKMLFGSYPYPPTPRFLSSIFEYILVFAKPGTRPKVDKSVKEASRLTKEEWLEYTNGIWKVFSTPNSEHPATFPMEIAQRVVRLFSFVGDTVLDPFAGSGTTVIAAEKYGRCGVGYEIAEDYRGAVESQVVKELDQQTIEGL